MKLRDILHISTRSTRTHLKRGAMSMMTMGVIFGLMFIINLWLQGVENSYKQYASEKTRGKVVIMIDNTSVQNNIDGEVTQPNMERGEIIKEIEAYGGMILGDMTLYGAYGGVILPQDIVQEAIEIDIKSAPSDAAPTLVTTLLGEQLIGENYTKQEISNSATTKQQDYEEYRKAIIGKTLTDRYGTKYFVVGVAPDNFHVSNLSFKQLEQKNNDLLNYVLRNIRTTNGRPIIVDNGKRASWQVGKDAINNIGDNSFLAVFNNNEDAYKYFKYGKANFPNIELSERLYSVSVIAGMSPEETYLLRAMKMIANVASIILAGAAAMVTIFTSIRLVDYDKKNIALYYSLGATRQQVKLIYLCYFAELMLGALLFAFGIASLVVILYSSINQHLLGIQYELGFSLLEAPRVIWYGVNGTTFIAMAVMLLLSSICALANNKRLSGETLEAKL